MKRKESKPSEKNRTDRRSVTDGGSQPSPAASAPDNTRWLWAVPVLLALAVNANVLQNGFGWDDENIIPNMKSPESWMALLFPGFAGEASKDSASYYRPLIGISYQIDHMIWGSRAMGYHLSVWLVHVLNTAMVFFLARSLMLVNPDANGQARRPSPANSGGSPESGRNALRPYIFVPLIAASLFAVHPVHAEAVAWIAGRNDVFCTAFLLASVLLYLRFRRTGNWAVFGFSMASFYLGLLAKEAAAGLAVVFLFYEWLAGHASDGDRAEVVPFSRRLRGFFRDRKRVVAGLVVPFALLTVYFLLRAVRLTHPAGEISPESIFPTSSVLDPLLALGYYFKIMLFPFPQEPFIPDVPKSASYWIFSVLAVFLSVWGILHSIVKRNVVLGIGTIWTLIILAPALLVTVLPLAATPVAERYVYGPSAGFLVAAAWLIAAGLRKWENPGWNSSKVWAMIGLGLALPVMIGGWESHQRNRVWMNPVSFWEKAAAASPDAGFPRRELGFRYAEEGRSAAAEKIYLEAIDLDKEHWGERHPEVAAGLLNLGVLYTDQNRFKEAEPLFLEAISIFDEKLIPDNPDVATGLLNLAGVYYLQGRYADAEPLYERSLGIFEKVLGAGHPNLTPSIEALAMVYYFQGKYERAGPLLERFVAESRNQTGAAAGPGLAGPLFRLGEIYSRQNRLAEARSFYEKSLEIQESISGTENLDLADTLNGLATADYTLGNYDKAEPSFKRSLAIREKLLGSGHPDLAVTLNGLAGLYYAQRRYDEAEPLFRRALEIREKSLGRDDPSVAQTLNNLGILHYAKGEYGKAEPLMTRSVAIRERVMGKDHPDLSTSLNSLAGLYLAQGRYPESKALFERAIAIREKHWGREHPDVASLLENYSVVLSKLNEKAKAAEVRARGEAIRRKQGGTAPQGQ